MSKFFFFAFCTVIIGSIPYVTNADTPFSSYTEGQLSTHISEFVEEKMEVYGEEWLLSALTFLEQTQALNPTDKKMYRVLGNVLDGLSKKYEIIYDFENTILTVNTIRTTVSDSGDGLVIDVKSQHKNNTKQESVSSYDTVDLSNVPLEEERMDVEDKDTAKNKKIVAPIKENTSNTEAQSKKQPSHDLDTSSSDKNVPGESPLDIDSVERIPIEEEGEGEEQSSKESTKNDHDQVEWIPIEEDDTKEVENKSLKGSNLAFIGREVPYDEEEIEKEWIRWVNKLRVGQGLKELQSDTTLQLRNTAIERADSLKEKQFADHYRSSKQCQNPSSNNYCYEYPVMVDRFEKRGLTFKNVNRATFTENIGRARYACTKDDCTQEVLSSIRHVFNYFASEQSYNGVHWRTMVQKNFKIAGVGVTLDESIGKAYVVIHYGTEIE